MHICVIGDLGSPHVRSRVRAFVDRGHRVSSVTPRAGGVAELDERVPQGTLNSPGYLLDLYRLVRDCPGDIVHVHYANSLGAWLALITGDRRPLLVSVMGGDVLFDEQSRMPPAAQWMTRQVLERAGLITAKSDHLAGVIRGMGIREEKIMTLRWGVDIELFRPVASQEARRALGLEEDARVILSPRILRPFYNIHIIIEAMPRILADVPTARLVICEVDAEADYKARLQNLTEELGVAGAVRFAGVQPHERMPEFYNMAEVTVGIPPSDGIPQTMLESMASGTPNVVGRLVHYEELVSDGDNVVLADLTADSVAGAIISLLKDEALAGTIGANGEALVRRDADLRRDVEKAESALLGLVNEGPARPRPLGVRLACALFLGALAIRSMFRNG